MRRTERGWGGWGICGEKKKEVGESRRVGMQRRGKEDCKTMS